LTRFRHVSILTALASFTIACAPAAHSSRPVQAEASFAPRSDPAFGDAAPAIRRLLAEAMPRPKGAQHFCAIGYRGPEGTTGWVHWREGERLILWLGRGDGSDSADALLRSNRSLNLKTDVVATEADVAGSTYLVTRAWVAAKLADCAAKGDKYTISAS